MDGGQAIWEGSLDEGLDFPSCELSRQSPEEKIVISLDMNLENFLWFKF